jgi:hypothetical protein
VSGARVRAAGATATRRSWLSDRGSGVLGQLPGLSLVCRHDACRSPRREAQQKRPVWRHSPYGLESVHASLKDKETSLYTVEYLAGGQLPNTRYWSLGPRGYHQWHTRPFRRPAAPLRPVDTSTSRFGFTRSPCCFRLETAKTPPSHRVPVLLVANIPPLQWNGSRWNRWPV